MELSLEEKKIEKEQAIYAAPSVRRQAELDYEKAERAMAQAKVDYKTQTEQAQAKMREVGADRDRQRNLLKNIMDVMTGMTIKAPAPGMVIYVKEWSGKKKAAGSAVKCSGAESGRVNVPDTPPSSNTASTCAPPSLRSVAASPLTGPSRKSTLRAPSHT